MCRALGVTRRGHCQWAPGPTSAHHLRDLELARLVGDEHGACMGTCGAPRILARPEAVGAPAFRRRVTRMMREHGWRGVTRACAKRSSGERRATKADPRDDPVGRGLAADGPNKAWFADVTCVRARQGRPCPAVVMDARSRAIVGWSVGPRATAGLADDAPGMAVAGRRPAEGRMHHGDHGARHASLLPGKTMRDGDVRPCVWSSVSFTEEQIRFSLEVVDFLHERSGHSLDRARRPHEMYR